METLGKNWMLSTHANHLVYFEKEREREGERGRERRGKKVIRTVFCGTSFMIIYKEERYRVY